MSSVNGATGAETHMRNRCGVKYDERCSGTVAGVMRAVAACAWKRVVWGAFGRGEATDEHAVAVGKAVQARSRRRGRSWIRATLKHWQLPLR